MNGITFSLVPVADEISPNKKVYRAYVKTNGTIDKEALAEKTCQDKSLASYFLDALYEYAAEAIAAEVVRINIGTVSLYPAIDGSFDSEDAEFDPERNSLYVGASFSQELRDAVAGIAPDIVDGQGAGTVKLHSCMDLESQVFKVIDGLKAFRLAGANLTVPDGSDESLGLFAKNGVDKVTGIEVSETDGGQRITCSLKQTDKVIPKGVYKVRLASHGLDPTDPLTVATLTVTLLADIPVAPPHYPATSKDGTTTVTGYCSSSGEDAEYITSGGMGFRGTGLDKLEGDCMWQPSPDAEWRYASGQMMEGYFAVGFADWSDLESGDYPDCRMKLVHPSGDIIVPFKATKL